MARPPVSHREFGFRLNRRGNRAAVSIYTDTAGLIHTAVLCFTPDCFNSFSSFVSVEGSAGIRSCFEREEEERKVCEGRQEEGVDGIYIHNNQTDQ